MASYYFRLYVDFFLLFILESFYRKSKKVLRINERIQEDTPYFENEEKIKMIL